ncbi:MAG: epoxyqueuosine reductase QueH [Elusimicrobiota bacterium]|jgi:predicted adenine nucleotide alpha hydrolase (AANH) superfamily ATPase|nr:epoxyqueuosine reductase QueH [Elusimicrobiota bacterium]
MRSAKLLLLSCCAPCSCAVIEKLHGEGRGFAVLFYNPNITPFAEYEKRKEENKKFCAGLGVEFFDLDYDNAGWLAAVRGLENEPERGARCRKCFEFRLSRAARFARERGFDGLSSVLGVSRHKNMADVNAAAKAAAAREGLIYDDTNWRKGGLEERRVALIAREKLYEQTYCGCEFSQKARGVK